MKNLNAVVISATTCFVLACSPTEPPRESAPPNSGFFASLETSDRTTFIQPVGKLSAPWNAAVEPPVYDQIKIQKSVMVPMRDGVRLSTDIYSPEGVEEPLPVILVRMPYGKNDFVGLRKPGSLGHFFAGRGYHVAVQDMRGRFDSEGEFTVSQADRKDGYDTAEWLANQSWSTGKIGTFGCSYLGENQIMMATERHPNHLAAIPQGAGGGYGGSYRPFGAYQGGAVELASGLGWFWNYGSKIFYRPPEGLSDQVRRSISGEFKTTPDLPEIDMHEAFRHLPLIDIIRHYGGSITDWEDFVSHPPGDPFWDTMNYTRNDDRFDLPTLHVNSWYDGVPRETTILFNLFRENAVSERGRDNQYMIMSPTAHCASERTPNPENAIVGARPMGDIRLGYFRIYLDWFGYWLKGEDNRVLEMPKVQYYLMGANRWQSSETWPPEGTEFRKLYLHSGGKANTRLGDGSLRFDTPVADQFSDTFTYDPADPVPSVGGPICCISADAAAAGSYDQSEVEMRDDVLVYTSEVLTEPVDVTGPIDVKLFVSSSARDTDFTVKLVDVYPDGTAYNVQEGTLRARYRESFENPVFMEPGKVYPLTVEAGATANRFDVGHRIRIEVSSSNFPRSDRNLNTGGDNFTETEWVVADNVIHHSEEYPSHILLPVLELKTAGAREN